MMLCVCMCAHSAHCTNVFHSVPFTLHLSSAEQCTADFSFTEKYFDYLPHAHNLSPFSAQTHTHARAQTHIK